MSETETETKEKIAIVRIRGTIHVNKDIRDTIRMLNLPFTNSCVIVPATYEYKGMVKKVKDYVTYGVVSEEVIKLLKEKRDKGKKFFRLHPPRKGFERKGTTRPYTTGGALGDRGEKINDLIKRMV